MAKLLLVQEVNNCMECQLAYDSYCCIITQLNFFDNPDNFDPCKDILDDCPLKEIPERKRYHEGIFNGEVKGWNSCIDEICKT